MSRPKSLSSKVERSKVADAVGEPPSKGSSLRKQVVKSTSKAKQYSVDLRIHSPASLGYLGIQGIDTAPALVRLARVKGIDIISVTDYFSGGFIDRVVDAAQGTPVVVLPGVDLRCRVGACDDITLTCLFPEGSGAASVHELLALLNVPSDAGKKQRFVLSQRVEEVIRIVESRGGILIPSRVDLTPHRASVLHELVEGLGFRMFNLAYEDSRAIFKERWPKRSFTLVSFSNANALAQVGSRSARVKLESKGFEGLRALAARAIVADDEQRPVL